MALFKVQGIVYRRVLSDNGFAYKSHGWRNAAQALASKVKKTRPYTPRTNGKAERFINSLLGEWTYVCPTVLQRHEMSCCRFSCGFCSVRRCHMDLGAVSAPSRGSLSCRHEQLGGKPQLGTLIAFLPLSYLCKVI